VIFATTYRSWPVCLVAIAGLMGCATRPQAQEPYATQEQYITKESSECALAISIALRDFEAQRHPELPATEQGFAHEFSRRFGLVFCREDPRVLEVSFFQRPFDMMDGGIALYVIDPADYTILERVFELSQ
jgi:hypothetical protein